MADIQDTIPYGFCQCGCGQKTPIAKRTRHDLGHIRNTPTKYMRGHNGHDFKGPNSPVWKGGIVKHSSGYLMVKMLGHPRANQEGYIWQHTLVAEKILGKFLPPKAVVHHVNGIKDDNRLANLVICENEPYHQMLHRRKRALEACGHADWRKCHHCKKWDFLDNLRNNKCRHFHPKCNSDYHKAYRATHVRKQYDMTDAVKKAALAKES